MYEAFFGFRERPFELVPNPRFLVMTPAHREALSNLDYGIAARKGITLLLGDAGSGKTTLIQAALRQQSTRVHCVYLPNPALTRDEFIEMLAAKFELPSRARGSKAALLLELEEMLRARHLSGEMTLLVVDEAQSVSMELLEEIRLLANFETPEQKLMSLVLAGQPELSDRLNNPALRQLKQRIALRCELRPLDLRETGAYLAGRIMAAGGAGAQVFTRDAVMAIHERSRGIPRLVSVIADNALISGFALQERPVTRKTVLEVCRDFDFQPSEPATESAPTGSAGLGQPPAGVAPETARAVAPVGERPTHMRESPRGVLFTIDTTDPRMPAANAPVADPENQEARRGFFRFLSRGSK
jgi:type II secretory pathway predicted ATPase ExeA